MTIPSSMSSSIFEACTEAERSLLLSSASVRFAAQRDTIVEEGQPFPYLGIVLDGVIAMSLQCSTQRLRSLRLYEAFPGETFGEIGTVDGALALGKAHVISHSAGYALVPREVILQVCASNSALFATLAQLTAYRSRELTRRLAAQATQLVTSRVATALLPYAAEDEDAMAPANQFLAELTQFELAATSGTVKEVFARTIARLEKAGALRRERGRIRYICRSRLRQFTEPQP